MISLGGFAYFCHAEEGKKLLANTLIRHKYAIQRFMALDVQLETVLTLLTLLWNLCESANRIFLGWLRGIGLGMDFLMESLGFLELVFGYFSSLLIYFKINLIN